MALKEYLIKQLGTYGPNHAWIFVIVKPGFEKYTQQIIEEFTSDVPGDDKHPTHTPWVLSKTRTKILLPEEARSLYEIHKKEDWYEDLWKYMSSGPTTGLLFVKPDEKVSKKMFKEVGAIKDYIRERWGESEMRNVIHSSDSIEHMQHEASIYFTI